MKLIAGRAVDLQDLDDLGVTAGDAAFARSYLETLRERYPGREGANVADALLILEEMQGEAFPMKSHDDVVERWTRLGAGLTGDAAAATPDLERLLLDTARVAPASPRLAVVAITWLSRCATLVAEHRLAALVRRELEDEHKPALGLLLAVANTHGRCHDRRRNLDRTIRLCPPATEARPFFEIEQRTPALTRRAERRASEVSRRWNLWMEAITPKLDALRPYAWIVARNADLAFRADLRGDLRASILLTLRESPGAGVSVSELGRRCGASRPAVVAALDDLELGGHLLRRRRGRSCECRIAA